MSVIVEIIKAIIFGVVEGITEWLPVSSTGHMIILQDIMPLNVSEGFWKMFNVVIQLGAIMAVVLLFWNKLSDITYKEALIIGVFQLLAAIFPGTSRSGATIIGGLMLGLSRKVAAEFTFFLAIPVMFGASLLKTVKYLFAGGTAFTGLEVMVLIIGIVTAFVVSIFVIGGLMNYIKKKNFMPFGWYRIALGIVVIIYSALR